MVSPQRIAIVGSGVAGLTCAHLLDPIHDIVLYEADARLGGHSNTVTVDDPTAGPIGVDTGFIVHNDRNYPNLTRLLEELDVPTIDSEMSFAVTDRASGLCYRATSPRTLFAERRNLGDRRIWSMLYDIARFYRAGRRYLDDPSADPGLTIGDLLAVGNYSDTFVDLHLLPMGAAVWSTPPADFRSFPAQALLAFLDNHGLLSIGDRPRWRTIAGGSRSYVNALTRRLRGRIELATPVARIERRDDRDDVSVATAAGRAEFDRVIVATHSDQALRLLDRPRPIEREVLGGVAYQPNRATLHTDTTLLPLARRAWAAWNYDRPADADPAIGATVTYDLTTLQRLPGQHRYLVSLNSDERIDPAAVIARFDYAHPRFDHRALAAQERIAELNDPANRVLFCGAWQGYGFHEDGAASAIAVARNLGATW